MIEACVHDETPQVVKLHKGFRFHREARTHVIVAVDNIIIIALRASQQYSRKENALFQLRQSAHIEKWNHHAWSKAGSFRYAIRGLLAAFFHGVGVVIVEMLEETNLRFKVCTRKYRCAPQASQYMNAIHERLITNQSQRQFHRKEIVRLTGSPVQRVAVFQKYIKERIVIATEHCSVISQIASAERDRKVYRQCFVIVILVIFVPHTPRLARYNSVKSTHRIDDCSTKLSEKTAKTPASIVQQQVWNAVQYFAKTYSAHRRGKNGVNGRRFHFAHKLPHQRTTQGIRCRLPERQTVATCRIIVQVAVVRVCKQVGRKLVVVPHKSIFKVLAYALEVYFCKVVA